MLDHTADIQMEVVGESLLELFVNAAQGLTRLIAERHDISADVKVEVALQADTVEDLMVDWLRELLFLHETQGFVLVRPEVVELSEQGIRAQLLGRSLLPHEIAPSEIKAVTYHDLSVEQTDKGFVTRVVFDV